MEYGTDIDGLQPNSIFQCRTVKEVASQIGAIKLHHPGPGRSDEQLIGGVEVKTM
jgi:hypothetical protein